MTRETERELHITYDDVSIEQDGTYDVSFELSEEAEDVLFSAFRDEISENIENGLFPKQELHLFWRISEQQNKHPPWFEVEDDNRVYDVTITEWDYHLLSKLIGRSLSRIIGPSGAGKYMELVNVLEDITLQMLDDEDTSTSIMPDDAQFECYVHETFRLYKDENGGRWFECGVCGEKFHDHDRIGFNENNIAEEHECGAE